MARSTPPGEPDTYIWLLTTLDGCPACGATIAPDAPACGACGRSLLVTVRPAERSQTVFTLAGAWAIGACGGALALLGSALRLTGALPGANNSPRLWLPLTLGTLALAVFATLMAWGCWTRRPFALYCGIALAALLGITGIGAGLIVRGLLALILVIVGVLAASALILMHLAAAREFLGERRRQGFATRATSAIGLYQEGRACYEAGLWFMAAQRWARAIGKDPGNPTYMHALGLVLARLGHYDRALGQIERALQAAPGNARIRESYEWVRREADTVTR